LKSLRLITVFDRYRWFSHHRRPISCRRRMMAQDSNAVRLWIWVNNLVCFGLKIAHCAQNLTLTVRHLA
jgi:hypothetical protein